MKLNQLAIVLGLSLVAACGGGKVDEVKSKLEAFKTKMCACTDAACADKVHDEYKQWEKELEKSLSDEDEKKLEADKSIEALVDARRECRRKAKGDAP